MDRPVPEWALPPLLVRERTSYGTADMLGGALLLVLELERPDMVDRFPLLSTGFIVIVVVVVVLVTGVDRPPGLLILEIEATLPFPMLSALWSLDVAFMGDGIWFGFRCYSTSLLS